jgi:hypothetical protein
MTTQQLLKLSNKISAELRSVPAERRMHVIRERLKEILDETDRQALENLILPGWEAHAVALKLKKTVDWRPWFVGGAAVALMLFACFAPNPTPFQLQIVRLVASFFAGTSAYLFSGTFNVKAKWGNVAVQGTAGFGVWFIVYYLFPKV